MYICFVCNEYPPNPHGGIGTFVRNLAYQLSALGHSISVVGYSARAQTPGWIQDGPVRVYQLAVPDWWKSALKVGRYKFSPEFLMARKHLSNTAQKIADETGADLVESYDWSGPLWFPLRNIPLVVRLHGANTASAFCEGRPASRLLHYMERRNVKMADALVAVSGHIGAVTLQSLGLSGHDFRVIYNGVDTQTFQPQPVEHVPSEVLYVGSLHRRKGIYDLMKAWPLVATEVPQARLTILGRLPDGRAKQDLVNNLLNGISVSLQKTVSFVGYVPHEQLPSHYSRATVAVFPSHAEAFGLTCAEAMACGAAVVMTSKGSGPELVQHGVSGVLADPSDVSGLAQAIIGLLQNPICRSELGKSARERTLQLFDSRALAEKNLAFYEDVIRGRVVH